MTAGGGANGGHMTSPAKSLSADRVEAQATDKLFDGTALFPGKKLCCARDCGSARKISRAFRKIFAATLRAVESLAAARALPAFRAGRESAPDGQFAGLQSGHIPLHHERCSLQLRYLTGKNLRVSILREGKNTSRSFPHGEKFCASMPPVHLLKLSFYRASAPHKTGNVLH
jgi:hypothetical protein